MTGTNFDGFIAEIEAQCNEKELELLREARVQAEACFNRVKLVIKRRKRIDHFVERVGNGCYGSRPEPLEQIVTVHEWPSDPFNHDGPCVEIKPRKCDGMRFTTLLFKNEIWAMFEDDTRATKQPVCVDGFDDDMIIDNFISYINGWLAHYNPQFKDQLS